MNRATNGYQSSIFLSEVDQEIFFPIEVLVLQVSENSPATRRTGRRQVRRAASFRGGLPTIEFHACHHMNALL